MHKITKKKPLGKSLQCVSALPTREKGKVGVKSADGSCVSDLWNRLSLRKQESKKLEMLL